MRGLKLGSFTEKSYQKKSVVIFWSLKNVMKLHVDPWPLIDIVQTVIEPFDLTSYPVTFSRFFFASWQIYIVLFQIRMNLSFKKHIFQRFFFFFSKSMCCVFVFFSSECNRWRLFQFAVGDWTEGLPHHILTLLRLVNTHSVSESWTNLCVLWSFIH